jgi:putative N6-adenine-specific DNA methylase
VTISADAVGRPLHRRGYRKATAKAPLRENLAASVLVASGWDPESEALADPMCGAGTFGIEAAWMARDRAPGRDLKPAVIEWPGFPRKGFHQLQRELELGNVSNTVRIFSSDRNEGALKAARANAQRAGVEGDIRFQCQSINDPVELDCERGLVVLNPPYGKRIGDLSRLHGLYKHFSKGLVQNYPGWRIAVVCPDKALAGRLAPGIQEVTRFRNGGIPVGLYLGEIPQSQK